MTRGSRGSSVIVPMKKSSRSTTKSFSDVIAHSRSSIRQTISTHLRRTLQLSSDHSSADDKETTEAERRQEPCCSVNETTEIEIIPDGREYGGDEEHNELDIRSAPATANNSISHQSHPVARRLLSDGAITQGIITPGRRLRKRRIKKRKYTSNYRPRKIVVVGDMHCGKSCLVSSYCADKFSEMYSPTIMKCLSADTKIQGKLVDIIVVDTPGRYDYLPLREVAYKKSDLVLICFALDSPQSLKSVEDFWVPEVQTKAPGIPYMLVGTRRDYRDELYANWCCCEICQDCHLGCQKGVNTLKRMEADKFLSSTMISYDQGLTVAREVGAVGYQECSAKFRDNTRSVFECATEMAMKKHRRKRKHKMRGPEACVIL